MRFQSWEFLLLSNIAICLIAPITFGKVRNSSIKYFFLFALLPFLFAASEHAFLGNGDFVFFCELYLLHYLVSIVNLALACHFLKSSSRPHVYYYGLVFLGIFLALAALMLSRALFFIDPFWGIIPGTVAMDPIIGLDPFFFRLKISCLVWLLLLFARRADFFFFALYASIYLFGPSSLWTSIQFHKSFDDAVREKNIWVYVQDSVSQKFSAETWAKEFSFYLEEIQSRLPSSVRYRHPLHFSIYVYKDDDTKAYWIGARKTQIGNFIQSEMHLSSVTPFSSILPHELAHLLHGQIEAPLFSYLNSFYLEGFAVALSSESLTQSVRESSAILKTLTDPSKKHWPTGISFFTALPPHASYALAGGFSGFALQQGRWPWEVPLPPTEDFEKLTVSSQLMDDAKKILSSDTPLKNPQLRDCSRLEWKLSKKTDENSWMYLRAICPDSEELLPSIYKMNVNLEKKRQLLEILNSAEAKGDRAALGDEMASALVFYKSCSSKLCAFKSKLIANESDWLFLRSTLLNEVEVQTKILAHFVHDPEALQLLVRMVPFEQKENIFAELSKLRELSESERFTRARLRFYSSLLKYSAIDSKQIAKQILREWKFADSPHFNAFKRRLEWELKTN